MREILFRGKDFSGVINHNWCFGCLDTTENDRAIIIYSDRFGNKCQVFVDPKTVGQYTGLADKNGTKIFEGDIVKCISRFDAKDMVVIFETAEFHLVDCQRYKNYTECCGYRHFGRLETEVIGNIHDNPKLLRGDTE